MTQNSFLVSSDLRANLVEQVAQWRMATPRCLEHIRTSFGHSSLVILVLMLKEHSTLRKLMMGARLEKDHLSLDQVRCNFLHHSWKDGGESYCSMRSYLNTGTR